METARIINQTSELYGSVFEIDVITDSFAYLKINGNIECFPLESLLIYE